MPKKLHINTHIDIKISVAVIMSQRGQALCQQCIVPILSIILRRYFSRSIPLNHHRSNNCKTYDFGGIQAMASNANQGKQISK